jgi:hypothetical protein
VIALSCVLVEQVFRGIRWSANFESGLKDEEEDSCVGSSYSHVLTGSQSEAEIVSLTAKARLDSEPRVFRLFTLSGEPKEPSLEFP